MGDLIKGKFQKPKEFVAVYNADYFEYDLYYGNDIICHIHDIDIELFLENFKAKVDVVIPITE